MSSSSGFVFRRASAASAGAAASAASPAHTASAFAAARRLGRGVSILGGRGADALAHGSRLCLWRARVGLFGVGFARRTVEEGRQVPLPDRPRLFPPPSVTKGRGGRSRSCPKRRGSIVCWPLAFARPGPLRMPGQFPAVPVTLERTRSIKRNEDLGLEFDEQLERVGTSNAPVRVLAGWRPLARGTLRLRGVAVVPRNQRTSKCPRHPA